MVQDDKKDVNVNTPGLIVLQWLTYAFWAWTAIAIAYISAAITSHMIDSLWASDAIEPIAYGAAATLILLPIAVICDWIYSKHEPTQKRGIASVIMIIHAVLFALISIGSLIVAAFSVINLLLVSGDTTVPTTALVVSLVLTALFADLTVRTLRPVLFTRLRLLFRIGMTLVALTALVWAVLGPIQQAVVTKDDRAVRDGLTSLNNAINQYASIQQELPATLAEVATDDYLLNSYPPVSAASLNNLIDRGLITYTPNKKPAVTETLEKAQIDLGATPSTTLYYELCGTFSHGLKQRPWYSSIYAESSVDSDGYNPVLNEGPIGVGTTCYKLSSLTYEQL